MPLSSESVDRAYRACAALARRHYENFPVASRLVPADMRPHIAAVYAFARIADDIADEGTLTAEARQAGLDRWRERLHAAAAGAPLAYEESRNDLVFAALGQTIRSKSLPVTLFDDLLSAFAQDITTPRYDSWDDLLDYCRRSANPVGRLVLLIGGYRSTAPLGASDALCTALQLTNFWQDLRRDWMHGRLYIPRAIAHAAGADERDLDAGRWTPAWANALGECATRTRALFAAGRPICDQVSGRLRFELRLTWLGGQRILDRVAGDPQQAFASRPTLGAVDLPGLLWRAVRWEGAAA
jgi:squalene synthase HpnC